MGQQNSVGCTQTEDINDNFDYDCHGLIGRDFGFENLVFEGGGVKTVCYASALKVLQKIGILHKFKRVAGSSGGAVAALLFAVGYGPDEIHETFIRTMSHIKDAKFGCFSFLPNVFSYFGLHPGERALMSLEDAVEEKTGNRKTTFQQLYDDRQIELCVVVASISSMSPEYFHVKTTPDVTIAEAVRMSVALPGFVAPYRMRSVGGIEKLYADGGLLCNYPIHAFDGWYLSLNKGDSFFKRFGAKETPFGKFNSKTLGLVVYSADECDAMKLKVHHKHKIPRPETKLAKKRIKELADNERLFERKANALQAAYVILNRFQLNDEDSSDTISREELQAVVDSEDEETRNAIAVLFGELAKFDIFRELDANSDDEISFAEFINFLERRHQINFIECMNGVPAIEINSVSKFLAAVLETVQINNNLAMAKEVDKYRTIGINTDYIQTFDLGLEPADYKFLEKQATLSTIHFLRNMKKIIP